ncbi:hypothetical protein [Stutzerimonas decontaminans]|uniref:hypothetical protein n=1 Tax=Stutzerimonas decontaminans TaxID=3022791 RepID=UPI0012D2BAF8|nr:hypothetical protein [Stutzerimonas decontaminans]
MKRRPKGREGSQQIVDLLVHEELDLVPVAVAKARLYLGAECDAVDLKLAVRIAFHSHERLGVELGAHPLGRFHFIGKVSEKELGETVQTCSMSSSRPSATCSGTTAT